MISILYEYNLQHTQFQSVVINYNINSRILIKQLVVKLCILYYKCVHMEYKIYQMFYTSLTKYRHFLQFFFF